MDTGKTPHLSEVYRALGEQARSKRELGEQLGLEEEPLEAILEKLWVHGGALIDPEERARRGGDAWRRPYEQQRVHKLEQLEQMRTFAATPACRMQQLVDYFGDQEDAQGACGQCDVCAPQDCLALSQRGLTDDELKVLQAIHRKLSRFDRLGAGRLFTETAGSLSRSAFEDLLSAMARAEMLEVRQSSFAKNGRTITYRAASLTPLGLRTGGKRRELERRLALLEPLGGTDAPAPKRARKSSARGSSGRAKPARKAPKSGADAALVEALKSWRLGVARKRGRPAFTVLTNRVLLAIAEAQPRSEDELLAVRGIGEGKLRAYGGAILTIVRRVVG